MYYEHFSNSDSEEFVIYFCSFLAQIKAVASYLRYVLLISYEFYFNYLPNKLRLLLIFSCKTYCNWNRVFLSRKFQRNRECFPLNIEFS